MRLRFNRDRWMMFAAGIGAFAGIVLIALGIVLLMLFSPTWVTVAICVGLPIAFCAWLAFVEDDKR